MATFVFSRFPRIKWTGAVALSGQRARRTLRRVRQTLWSPIKRRRGGTGTNGRTAPPIEGFAALVPVASVASTGGSIKGAGVRRKLWLPALGVLAVVLAGLSIWLVGHRGGEERPASGGHTLAADQGPAVAAALGQLTSD